MFEARRDSRPAAVALEIASYAGYATRRFADQHGLQAAAAVTFTTLLAVVPLLAITLGVFSAFPAFAALRADDVDARGERLGDVPHALVVAGVPERAPGLDGLWRLRTAGGRR